MKKSTINVLLIDDDTEYYKVVHYHLRRFGKVSFNLLWKRNGEEGLQEIQTNPSVDVVLMDYVLSGMDGIEVVKTLGERKVTVPVIFLTTQRNTDVAVEALRLGVHDYLVKDDVTDRKLPQAILTVLERIDSIRRAEEAEQQKVLEQKRAEAIRELIVTINHEINNPLAAIKISTDILSRQNLSEHERLLLQDLLQKIEILEKEVSSLKNLSIDSRKASSSKKK
jgi:DNA-binding response OmpR family regulator